MDIKKEMTPETWNNTRNVYLSVVLPAYNEEENIKILYANVKKALDALKRTYEIIFIDDGSTDNTFAVLQDLYKGDSTLKLIKLRKNFGQTPAMSAGIDNAEGDIIITMDSDLQNDPQDIENLLKKLDEGYDIVSGWRKDRKDKAISRKIPSKIANWMIGAMTGVKIHDYGCTLKAYRASILKEMHLYSDMHRFIPAMGRLSGSKVAEIVVRHHPRIHGKSKYGISRTIKVMLDVISIKLITQFSSMPLRLFGNAALMVLFLSFLLSLKTLQMYILHEGYSSFPLVIPSATILLFFLGMYLACLGFLSELILKMSDFRLSRVKTTFTQL